MRMLQNFRLSLVIFDNPGDCLYHGLSGWLDGGERSWRDVVDALSSRTVECKDLAITIEREYLQPEPATTGGQQQHGEDCVCVSCIWHALIWMYSRPHLLVGIHSTILLSFPHHR